MPHSISLSDERPSAFSSFIRRTFKQASGRHNFVKPLAQAQDPEFPCPCCGEALSVPASQAGKNGRCRHCYEPIRNADPDRELPAIDLSRELDPLSRPEDYPLCGHRATALDYVPHGAISALPLLTLIALGIAMIALLPKGNVGLGALAAVHAPTPVEVLTSPALEAEAVVTEFLTAPDWTESVAHVHAGLEFATEVAALTEQLPTAKFSTSSRLNGDGTSTVRVNFGDGSVTQFQVANIDGEDLILWNANPERLPDGMHSRMVGMPEMEPK